MRLTHETNLFPLRKGAVARQAHVDLPPGTFEEEFARHGFYGRTAHLYRRHPVTAWTRIEGPLRPHSYDLNRVSWDQDLDDSRFGSREPAFSPVCLLHNEDVALHWVAPGPWTSSTAMPTVTTSTSSMPAAGGWTAASACWTMPRGDYLVIPRGTTYRFLPGPSPSATCSSRAPGKSPSPTATSWGPTPCSTRP